VMYAVEYMDGNRRKGVIFRNVPTIPKRISCWLGDGSFAYFDHVPRIKMKGWGKERDCAYLETEKCWFVPECCTLEGAIVAQREGTTAASAEAAREVKRRTQQGYEDYLRALRADNEGNVKRTGKKLCKNCNELNGYAKKICTRCNRDPNEH